MLIYKYILKAHVGPFLFSFFTVTLLFVLQFLVRTIDQLVGKGLSIWVIIQLITLNLAWIVTLAVPMAVLVSTIMAFGSLSANNEIMVMKANGVGLNRLVIPVLIVTLIISYLLIRFNNDVLPEANHQARLLLGDISRTKPTFILESGKFSDDINGIKILARKTFENSNNLEGIYIFDYSDPIHKNLITAESGDIGFTTDFKNIVMNLTNGEIHQLDNRNYAGDYRKVKFTKHRLIFPAEGFTFQRSSDNAFMRGDRELSADEMRRIIDSLRINVQNYYINLSNELRNVIIRISSLEFKDTTYKLNAPVSAKDTVVQVYRQLMNVKKNLEHTQQYKQTVEDQIDMYLVEIYKKYSIPFACIVFILIGAPLGYRVKKGNFGIAAGLSLLFFIIYWAALIGGEKLADRGFITPFLGMWLVNIVLGGFGLYLMLKSS